MRDDGTFPDYMTRTRRDHMKLLTLIEAIALLHQLQRPIKRDTRDGETLEYIEVTTDDVKLAEKLMRQVLGPSLDELPPQTKRVLSLIEQMVNQECERQEIETDDYRFTRRRLRQYTRCGDTQLRVHLRRLEELEYLVVRRGGPGKTFVYQIQTEKICRYDGDCACQEANHAGVNESLAGGARGAHGAVEIEPSTVNMRPRATAARSCENTYMGEEQTGSGIIVVPNAKPKSAAKPNSTRMAGAI
jgi:hypothetical protein